MLLDELESYNESWKTNRSRKREPKRALYWCGSCDQNLVEHGKKCKNCNQRTDGHSRDKNR